MSKSIKKNHLSIIVPTISTEDKGFIVLSIKELDSLRNRLNLLLEKLPNETLIISNSNGCTQYYYYSNIHRSRKIFIPKSSIEYAIELATREYYELLIKEIDRQLISLNNLSICDTKRLVNIYDSLRSEKQCLVKPLFPSDDEFVKQWYYKHPGCANGYEITTGYDTERGEIVRSKSEKIIADKLYSLNIPYVYEYRLSFDDQSSRYPDFTILNVYTRRTWYWEHFGLTDNADYRDNMIHKINSYESNGLFLGDGLIITMEGERSGLDGKLMTAKINKYLLN
ncbi:MAG: hypothetical protein K5868_06320 [Lachnospiraceae bacterium]|nr:hypothetical protein [Lachnospiraceae bacterium]